MNLLSSALIFGLIVSTATMAEAKDSPKSKAAQEEFGRALKAIMGEAQPSAVKTQDNDQGDDHASDRAKLEVCTKNTPAARRSAICPVPISP